MRCCERHEFVTTCVDCQRTICGGVRYYIRERVPDLLGDPKYETVGPICEDCRAERTQIEERCGL